MSPGPAVITKEQEEAALSLSLRTVAPQEEVTPERAANGSPLFGAPFSSEIPAIAEEVVTSERRRRSLQWPEGPVGNMPEGSPTYFEEVENFAQYAELAMACTREEDGRLLPGLEAEFRKMVRGLSALLPFSPGYPDYRLL